MATDILLGVDFDLDFKDGDFAIGQDLEQRINCILAANKGHYKQFPLLGAHLIGNLQGVFGQAQAREIQLNLQADGIKISAIKIQNGGILINASDS